MDNSAITGGTIKVRNRDIPLLSSIFLIMQDVCLLERQREWQKDRMLSITQHLTGMPGGGGLPKGLEETFSKLSEIDAELVSKYQDYVHQLREAQKILNSIENHTIKTFVSMRYIMSIPDARIRQDLNMTRRCFDRACRAVEEAPNMASVKWHDKYVIS